MRGRWTGGLAGLDAATGVRHIGTKSLQRNHTATSENARSITAIAWMLLSMFVGVGRIWQGLMDGDGVHVSL